MVVAALDRTEEQVARVVQGSGGEVDIATRLEEIRRERERAEVKARLEEMRRGREKGKQEED